jgi:hypothetical protein
VLQDVIALIKEMSLLTYIWIFSYSASSEFSGITHDATAFVGCDAGKVCIRLTATSSL